MSHPKPKKVFIVEDETDLLDLAIKHLETKGYLVFSARSGEEALASTNLYEVDIVLLDWMLPGKSGLEICKELVGSDKTKHIPIVFMSAKDQFVDVGEALSEGAQYYITKPYSFSDLVAAIEKYALKGNI
jgi:DNA-binding response OmpR family regulator